MNDVLSPHIKQDKWKELETKLHDDSIPMKPLNLVQVCIVCQPIDQLNNFFIITAMSQQASSWDIITNILFDDWSNVSFRLIWKPELVSELIEAGHPTPDGFALLWIPQCPMSAST